MNWPACGYLLSLRLGIEYNLCTAKLCQVTITYFAFKSPTPGDQAFLNWLGRRKLQGLAD